MMANAAGKRSAESRSRLLAVKYGAVIDVGIEEVAAELADGRTWDFSGTCELIASRESGESMAAVWADLLKQMSFGLAR